MGPPLKQAPLRQGDCIRPGDDQVVEHPDIDQGERIGYERLDKPVAAVEKLDERGAVQRITEVLSKSARGRREQAGEAEEAAASKAA